MMPRERGAAIVELAVVMPVLLILVLGAVDFGRVFYTSMELANAARAGAQYGAQNTAFSAAAVQTQAEAAAPSIIPYTATVSQSCACLNAAGSGSTHSCTTACGSGEHLVVYERVQTTKQFQMVAAIPGLPSVVGLTRTATMRAQ